MHLFFELRIALAIAAGLAFGGAASAQSTAFREAVERQQRGDLEGARAAYVRVLASEPSNYQAQSNLGATLAALGRYREAEGHYQEALRLAPAQYKSHLRRNIALAFYKGSDFREALEQLALLRATSPEDLSLAMLAADCLVQLGRASEAVSLLEPLASAAGQDKGFGWIYGIARLKSGDIAGSQTAFRPILADRDTAESQYALGLIQLASGDIPGSVPFLQRAEELGGQLPRVHAVLGEALLQTGDADAALAAFERQLKSDPDDFDANLQAAAILNHRSKFASAEPLLRRAIGLQPESLNARYALSTALIGLKNSAEARKNLEIVVQAAPTFGAAHERLAAVYKDLRLPKQEAAETALAKRYAPKDGAAALEAGLAVGSQAPAFLLANAAGGDKTSLPNPTAERPAVLVFGSYSCPNYRFAAPALNEFASRYGTKMDFRLVYIREAHSTSDWQSTINTREAVTLAAPSSVDQKQEYASMCVRKLHISFPALVDGMDNAAEQAYRAWPSRVYVIDGKGLVRYASGLSEIEFDRAALQRAITAAQLQ